MQKLFDLPVLLLVVHEQGIDLLGEPVPDQAPHQVESLVEELGRGGPLRLLLDPLPGTEQELEIALQVFPGHPQGGRAGDESLPGGLELVSKLFEPGDLIGVGDPPRYRHPVLFRQEHPVSSGQADLGSALGVLLPYPLAAHLDDHRLAWTEDLLDGGRALPRLEPAGDEHGVVDLVLG